MIVTLWARNSDVESHIVVAVSLGVFEPGAKDIRVSSLSSPTCLPYVECGPQENLYFP